MTTSEQSPIKDSKCDNCGEELLGTFCWVCGQKDSHYNRSLFKIIGDFFKEMFDVDSRVFTTLSTLFFRPGTLSIQFRENKRASYVTPIRLYLFSSLVFFFLVAITSQTANVQLGNENNVNTTDQSPLASIQPSTDSRSRSREEIDDCLSSIRSSNRIDDRIFESAKDVLKGRIATLEHDPWCEAIFVAAEAMNEQIGYMASDLQLKEAIQRAEEAHKRMRVLQEFYSDDPVTLHMGEEILKTSKQGDMLNLVKFGLSHAYRFHREQDFEEVPALEIRGLRLGIHAAYNGKDFLEDMTENLPLMMFVLLPIFVSLLALMSIGKGIRVVFQLIFAMHIHALAFISLTIGILLSLIISRIPFAADIMSFVLVLFVVVHIYLSFKNFYGSGHIVSLLKFFVISFLYMLMLGTSLTAMMAYFTLVQII